MAERILGYAQRMQMFLPSLLAGAGGAAGKYAIHAIYSNKSIRDVVKSFNEWGPAIIGVAIGTVFDLLKDRIGRNADMIKSLVDGAVASLVGESISTMFGLPFAFIKDGKLYTKNINPVNNQYIVVIDGNVCSASTDGTINCNVSIAEGVHDVAVLGDKAYYLKQYTEAIGQQQSGR